MKQRREIQVMDLKSSVTCNADAVLLEEIAFVRRMLERQRAEVELWSSRVDEVRKGLNVSHKMKDDAIKTEEFHDYVVEILERLSRALRSELLSRMRLEKGYN